MGNTGDSPPPIHRAGHERGPIDVSKHTMLDLLTTKDPAIAGAIRRLLADRHHGSDVLLGFDNACVTAADRKED